MNTRNIIKLSAVLDKMGIAKEIANIEKANNEEVGKTLITLVMTNLYKAEDEIYDFISIYKGITIEEAKEIDAIKIVKELIGEAGIKDFLV